MTDWISCAAGFIPADVVKWTEAIWEEQGGRSKRPSKIGKRWVVAEVIEDDGRGWLRLLVRGSAIVSDGTDHRRAHPLKPGETVRRKRQTIERGGPERLRWSDESAREVLRRQPGPHGAEAPGP